MSASQFEQDRHVQARINRYHTESQQWREAQKAPRADREGFTFLSSLKASMHATLQRLHLETRATLDTIKPESPVCLPGEAC